MKTGLEKSNFQVPLRAGRIWTIYTREWPFHSWSSWPLSHLPTAEEWKPEIRPFASNRDAAAVTANRETKIKVFIQWQSLRGLSTRDLLQTSLYYLFIFLTTIIPSTACNSNCCMGSLVFSHLNGIRATHGPGYVGRLFLFLQHMVTSKWDPSQTPGDHVAQIPNLIMYTAQNVSPWIKLELFFFFHPRCRWISCITSSESPSFNLKYISESFLSSAADVFHLN